MWFFTRMNMMTCAVTHQGGRRDHNRSGKTGKTRPHCTGLPLQSEIALSSQVEVVVEMFSVVTVMHCRQVHPTLPMHPLALQVIKVQVRRQKQPFSQLLHTPYRIGLSGFCVFLSPPSVCIPPARRVLLLSLSFVVFSTFTSYGSSRCFSSFQSSISSSATGRPQLVVLLSFFRLELSFFLVDN
jgi:hypothetical protein